MRRGSEPGAERLSGMIVEQARRFCRLEFVPPRRLAIAFKPEYSVARSFCQRPRGAAVRAGVGGSDRAAGGVRIHLGGRSRGRRAGPANGTAAAAAAGGRRTPVGQPCRRIVRCGAASGGGAVGLKMDLGIWGFGDGDLGIWGLKSRRLLAGRREEGLKVGRYEGESKKVGRWETIEIPATAFFAILPDH